MLVLTRKALQSVMIGQGVRVTVLATDGNRVRLGIEAPDSVTVLRSELLFEGRDDDGTTDVRPAPAKRHGG